MAKLLSGNEASAEIRSRLKEEVSGLTQRSEGKFQPGLTIVQVRHVLHAFSSLFNLVPYPPLRVGIVKVRGKMFKNMTYVRLTSQGFHQSWLDAF